MIQPRSVRKNTGKSRGDSRLDADLERATAVHLIQRLLEIVNCEHVRDLETRDRYQQGKEGVERRTIPFTRTAPLSRYATALGKQCVCANEPII